MRQREEQCQSDASYDIRVIVERLKRYRRLRILKRACFLVMIAMICTGMFGWAYYRVDSSIPSLIHIRAGKMESILLGIPAKAEIIDVSEKGSSNIPENAVEIDLSKALHVKMNQGSVCNLQVKLFGFLPFKQIDIKGIEDTELIPVGMPIGLYVETDGVLVIGTAEFQRADGKTCSPCENRLKSGDYIMRVNGSKVAGKEDLMTQIHASLGKPVILSVEREKKRYEISVVPEMDIGGEYRLGLWVRDNAQGVGTMTYVDANGRYGALGHGITDVDTSTLMHLSSGLLYETSIIHIKKGEAGTPGEITGMITYMDDRIIGTITDNDDGGIHGYCNPEKIQQNLGEALPIGLKQEIERGPAQILCNLDGTAKYYDVEITAVHLEYDKVNRGIELKVTDDTLLKMTGGIIQGMSGSPIIQNGKIIGAVTHVLVNDPTRGYGIFIENMLK